MRGGDADRPCAERIRETNPHALAAAAGANDHPDGLVVQSRNPRRDPEPPRRRHWPAARRQAARAERACRSPTTAQVPPADSATGQDSASVPCPTSRSSVRQPSAGLRRRHLQRRARERSASRRNVKSCGTSPRHFTFAGRALRIPRLMPHALHRSCRPADGVSRSSRVHRRSHRTADAQRAGQRAGAQPRPEPAGTSARQVRRRSGRASPPLPFIRIARRRPRGRRLPACLSGHLLAPARSRGSRDARLRPLGRHAMARTERARCICPRRLWGLHDRSSRASQPAHLGHGHRGGRWPSARGTGLCSID